jgi:hypothetical protein
MKQSISLLSLLELQALEDQNVQLMERNQTIEEEYRKVLAFKTLMDSYKDQVATLETKNNELIREKNKMEYEMQHMTKRVQSLEEDKANDTEQIQLLEDRLQEIEMNGIQFFKYVFLSNLRLAFNLKFEPSNVFRRRRWACVQWKRGRRNGCGWILGRKP